MEQVSANPLWVARCLEQVSAHPLWVARCLEQVSVINIVNIPSGFLVAAGCHGYFQFGAAGMPCSGGNRHESRKVEAGAGLAACQTGVASPRGATQAMQ